MTEHLRVEAIRLHVSGGKPRVRQFDDAGTALGLGSANWGIIYSVSHIVNSGGDTGALCERLEGIVGQTYQRAVGGVTNRLRQALRNANRYLYLRNRIRRAEHAILAAMGCLAIRGTEAFACGAGPHNIFFLGPGRVRSLVAPVTSGGLDADGWRANGGYLLGRSARLTDPRFSYRQILPGDWILVSAGTNPAIGEQNRDRLEAIAAEKDLNSAAHRVARLLGESGDFSAVLMRVVSQSQTSEKETFSTGTKARSRMAAATDAILPSWRAGRPAIGGMRDPWLKGRSASAVGDGTGLGASRPLTAAARPAMSADRTQQGILRGRGAAQASGQLVPQVGQLCKLVATLLVALLGGLWQGLAGMVRAALRLGRRVWRWTRQHRVAEKLAKGCQLALVGSWAASKGLVVRILPERQASPTGYGASAKPMARARVLGFQPSRKSRALVGLLILVVVFVAIAGSALRIRWRLVQAELEVLATQVDETLMLAEQQEDWGARVALLAEAQETLDQASDVQRGHAEFRDLSERVERQMDGATGVARIPFEPDQLLAVSEGVSGRVLVRGQQLYALDELTQRVYVYALDQGGNPVVDQDPVIWEADGEAGTLPVGPISDVDWVDAANGRLSPALLMLTSEGSLVELNSAGVFRNVSVSNLQWWDTPKAVRTYNGNLYVLDVGRGNILKYLPTADDYQQPPLNYVQDAAGVPWASVIDMGIDGSIYLLVADGSVVRLVGGYAEPFPQEGLYPALENPVAIFASPDCGSVFVAEPEQARIVEFTPDGQFVRQFRAALGGEDPLRDLQAFGLDVSHDRLIIATLEGIYNAPLPSAE